MVDTFEGPHEVKVEKQGFQSIIKPVNADPKTSVVVVPFKLDALPVGEKSADAKVRYPHIVSASSTGAATQPITWTCGWSRYPASPDTISHPTC